MQDRRQVLISRKLHYQLSSKPDVQVFLEHGTLSEGPLTLTVLKRAQEAY